MALLETFTDDFESGLSGVKWPVLHATATITSGQLQLSSASGTTNYAEAKSSTGWDATASSLLCKVAQTGAYAGARSTQTYMSIEKDTSNFIFMCRNDTNLSFSYQIAGVQTDFNIATWNASTMLWWRIRHVIGTGFIPGWSADGTTWTEATARTVSWAITNVRVNLGVGKYSADAVNAVALFDNVNLPPVLTATPDGLAPAVNLDNPTGAFTADTTPDGIAAPVTLDAPILTLAPNDTTCTPDGLAVPAALDNPVAALLGNDTACTPTGIAVALTVDPYRQNSAANGTAGTDVTTANSLLSGHAFTVATQTSTQLQYATVAGNLWYRLESQVPVGTAPSLRWTVNLLSTGLGVTRTLWRVDDPAVLAAVVIHAYSNIAGAVRYDNGWYVSVAANKLNIRIAGSGATIATSTTSIAGNTTYDLEFRTTAGTGCTLLIRDAAGNLLETLTVADTTNAAGWTVTYIYFGGVRTTAPSIHHYRAMTFAAAVDAWPTVLANTTVDLDTLGALPVNVDAPTAAKITAYGAEIVPSGVALDSYATALQIMGIGSQNTRWRGAPNYGLKPAPDVILDDPGMKKTTLPGNNLDNIPGIYNPAPLNYGRPVLPLPEATTSGFTLRLNGGDEARSEHAFHRSEAIFIEEMLTDLWWRRREPSSGLLEGINRFNADKVDIAVDGPDVHITCSWVDYRALLEDRLVLDYLNPALDPPESTWPINTNVTEILKFAIPDDMYLDVTELNTAALLGTTTAPYELPPGTNLETVFTNLISLSRTTWDWWVEIPASDVAQPKLRFAVNGRGTDRGVVVFDVDGTNGPILNWKIRSASDNYANTIFYSGSDGGVVRRLSDDAILYGQRDAQESDNSLDGTKQAALEKAADKRLQELADRTPTFDLTLRPGFWQGRAHIDVGDWISIYVRLGEDLMAGKHRVTEIDVDIDANGEETVTLTCGTPRPFRDPRSRKSAVSRIIRRLKNYTPKGTLPSP